MKELHNLPVYAEHVSGVGKYVEYECVVSGKGLSAKGRHLLFLIVSGSFIFPHLRWTLDLLIDVYC